MAHQVALKMAAQERFDLPDFISEQTYISDDFKRLNKGLLTAGTAYILNGFGIAHAAPSLTFSITIAGSTMVMGGSDGSMYYGEAGTSAISITTLDATTTYHWLELTIADDPTSAQTRTFWDPAANNGVGAEFQQIVNTKQIMTLTPNRSTVAMGTGAGPLWIPICTTVALAGNITSFTDNRPMIWRLGRGGLSPSMDYVYPWTAGRTEPGITGSVSIFSGGDKQFTCLKDCIAAIQSNIKEMKFGTGTGPDAVWYAPTPGTLADSFIEVTGGGVWSWVSVGHSLSFTEDAHILIPGTAYINRIPFTTQSPIVLPPAHVTKGEYVAWVTIDRTSNAPLTVTVSTQDDFVPGTDKFIIVRRILNAVYIGIQ